MKKYYAIIAAMSLMAAAQTVSAQLVLFSDNFTNTATSGDTNINRDLGGGRLGGVLAPGLITSGTAWTATGSPQVGNTVTNVGQPTVSDGNYLLMPAGGINGVGAATAFDVAALGAAQAGPLTISFDMYVTPGNTTLWGSVGLTTSAPVDGTNFFMLQQDNGPLQMYTGGNPSSIGTGANGLWTFTFSNTAGTGSAFVGNGSQVTIQNNATTVGTFALTQLPSSGLKLTFADDAINVGFDNVSITTVPEPSTYALAVAGLVCLALVCRYRRVIA